MCRILRLSIVTAVLGCASLAAGVVNAETWNCREFDLLGLPIGDPVFVAETGETDGIGSIDVSGAVYSARYEVLETNRIWLWGGGPTGTSQQALRIHPDGSGAFFDLTLVEDDEVAHAAQLLICEQE